MADNKIKYSMTKERWAWYQKEIQRLRQLDKLTTDRVRATWTENKQ